jgi:hypothetical protein
MGHPVWQLSFINEKNLPPSKKILNFHFFAFRFWGCNFFCVYKRAHCATFLLMKKKLPQCSWVKTTFLPNSKILTVDFFGRKLFFTVLWQVFVINKTFSAIGTLIYPKKNSTPKSNKCAHLIGLRGLKYYEKGL